MPATVAVSCAVSTISAPVGVCKTAVETVGGGGLATQAASAAMSHAAAIKALGFILASTFESVILSDAGAAPPKPSPRSRSVPCLALARCLDELSYNLTDC